MRVLIVAPLAESSSGNAVTSRRLAAILGGDEVQLVDCDVASPANMAAVFAAFKPDVLICVHGYRAGRVLPGHGASLPCPLVLVLGGTDVSCYMQNCAPLKDLCHTTSAPVTTTADHHTVLAAVISAATAVVAFSGALAEGLRAYAGPDTRVQIIPQGCDIAVPPQHPSLHTTMGCPPTTPVILLAAGFRPVKDNLFIVEAFVRWRVARVAARDIQDALPIMVLVGPALDAASVRVAHEAAGVSPEAPFGGVNGVYVHPSVPRDTLLAWLAQAAVALNTSLSEGQSNFLLEAMFAGTPIVARRCPGNEALVCHGETGLLFCTPDEGVMACVHLCCQDGDLAPSLTRRARAYFDLHHSTAAEQRAWRALLGSLAAPWSPGGFVVPCNQYVPIARCALSPRQLHVTATVVAGLAFLSDCGPVVPLPAAQPGKAVSPSSVGAVPANRAFPWIADAATVWPAAPFVYDFGPTSSTERPAPSAVTEVGQRALVIQPNIMGDGPLDGPVRLGWGCFAENRNIYTSEHFAAGDAAEARSWHLGVDLEAPVGCPVFAPMGGTVHSAGVDDSPLGYGPTIILQHALAVTRRCTCADGISSQNACTGASGPTVTHEVYFYTLYGHLSRASLFYADGGPRLAPGSVVKRGHMLGRLGSPLNGENGGWFPHVHFQICTELNLGGWRGDYPGVCRLGDWPAYAALTVDPNIVLRCPWVAPRGWTPRASAMCVAARPDFVPPTCAGIVSVVVS